MTSPEVFHLGFWRGVGITLDLNHSTKIVYLILPSLLQIEDFNLEFSLTPEKNKTQNLWVRPLWSTVRRFCESEYLSGFTVPWIGTSVKGIFLTPVDGYRYSPSIFVWKVGVSSEVYCGTRCDWWTLILVYSLRFDLYGSIWWGVEDWVSLTLY